MVATKPASAAVVGRCVAMSRSGRYVAVAETTPTGSKLEVIDALGTAPRVLLADEVPTDHTFVGDNVWRCSADELVVTTVAGVELARHPTASEAAQLWPSRRGDASSSVLRSSGSALLLSLVEGTIAAVEIGEDFASADCLTALHGNRVLGVTKREYMLGTAGRGVDHRAGLPGSGTAIVACEILAGKALAIVSRSEIGCAFDIIRPRGSLIHHIEHDEVTLLAFAEDRGLAISYGGGVLSAIDLRYGRVLHSVKPPLAPLAIEIDTEGRHVVMAGYPKGAARLAVYHVPFADVFQHAGASVVRLASADGAAPTDSSQQRDARTEDAADSSLAEGPDPATAVPDEPAREIEVPVLPLLALRNEAPAPHIKAPAEAKPYRDGGEHLGELLDLVVARTACAIANAWDSGELSQPLSEGLPFEREVRALIGHRAEAAPQLFADATTAVERIGESIAMRTQATLAAGELLPLVAISRQFGLSPVAAHIIPVIAAPSLRREAARLFGILSNDTARPLCDRALVETVLAGGDAAKRAEVASALDSGSMLLANGLIRATGSGVSDRLFAPLAVDSVLLRRLSGELADDDNPSAVTALRVADRTFDELVIPARIKRDLIVALAEPTATPPRVVIRGRPGFGRTSLLAALAAKVEMPLAVIDTERMLKGDAFPSILRGELQRATLRGALPCVSGLENRPRDEHDQSEHVRAVFRTFAGPIAFRTSVEFHPPLDPGFFSFVLPTLLESERQQVWETVLSRRQMNADSARRLASRYLVGPGTIESIVSTLAARKQPSSGGDLAADLDSAARQHLEARLGDVANRVERLARWEQVALPDDMIDSIREFIGRVMHRRTVYESWGFADKMATSRGLTALFYGQPGTGKTMVAGLIARELGLDLYRVDLANITSKWIGETEKNLGRVFDAAEDGQAVILFDEADSLFAKRTEVKSSVDRYANLEVNYLLQRFDSFEGVAILTTNMEGAIDSAFKRRLSLRLEFPFPDEEMRVRLWAAHIPTQAPTRGDFDFASLAKRFPMSGGYIRNSALRAAFLAAQEGELLSHEHLERAIHLEYREMGKLSPGGRMA